MGEVADSCGIQFRLLNTSRGPAVWSPRAQCDKALYRVRMREKLESIPNLFIKQAEVVDVVLDRPSAVAPHPRHPERSADTSTARHPERSADTSTARHPERSADTSTARHPERSAEREAEGPLYFARTSNDLPEAPERPRITGLKLRDGRTIQARAVVITTGTFLNGLIHCGEQQYTAGRSGEPASVLLGESLKKLGLRETRLKTGTPPRLDGRTIDWTRFEEQPGDTDPTPFSFRTLQALTTPQTLSSRPEPLSPQTLSSPPEPLTTPPNLVISTGAQRSGETPVFRSKRHESKCTFSDRLTVAQPGFRQPRSLDPTPPAGLLPHRLHHPRDPPAYPRQRPPLAHVHRPDRRHRPTLLPVHRRQDRPLPRQDPTPVLPGARRPQHPRGLHQRHVHQPPHGGAVRDGSLHPRPRKRRDATPRLRHRVRRHRPHRARPDAQSKGIRRPLPCRPDQRHLRLRGGRLPGFDGRHQCRPLRPLATRNRRTVQRAVLATGAQRRGETRSCPGPTTNASSRPKRAGAARITSTTNVSSRPKRAARSGETPVSRRPRRHRSGFRSRGFGHWSRNLHPRPHRSLHRHPDRRPHLQGHRRALPDVHLARRVPPPPAHRQRRYPPHPAWPSPRAHRR